jgi:hypothetical protein
MVWYSYDLRICRWEHWSLGILDSVEDVLMVWTVHKFTYSKGCYHHASIVDAIFLITGGFCCRPVRLLLD